MKAAVRKKYGPPESLKIEELNKPIPGDDDVLIRVHAATVSRTDCHNLIGKPWIMPLVLGFPKPRLAITGTDFAGEIETVGKNVQGFTSGDRVMGFKFEGLQSHAEYTCLASTKNIIQIPDNVDYQQAVASVEGAFYAINGMNNLDTQPGQHALVIGATGAIGSSYVQFFRNVGVLVTAVCKAEHSALVKSLGAKNTFDYQTEDFTKTAERFDFVVDAVDKSSYLKCRHLLKDKGYFTSSGGFINLFFAILTRITGGKKVLFIPPTEVRSNLTRIINLVAEGKFKPLIDRIYPLDKIAEAFQYVMTGQKLGNVIITFNSAV